MKNSYEIRGEITVIFMNSPKYGPMETIISTTQLEKVKEFKNTWYAICDEHTGSFYAVGNMTIALKKRRVYGLHQWIKGIPDGKFIDHRDHNTLNNTDINLREVTNAENMQNRRGASRISKSGVRGVYWHKSSQKWSAEFRCKGKKTFVGLFDTIEEAERVVIEARAHYMPFSLDSLKRREQEMKKNEKA